MASRVTEAGVGAIWIWTGVAYHGLFFPHVNKAALAFGALFTFGLALVTSGPVQRTLLVIPLVWSLIGGSAALLLGIPQDGVLLFQRGADADTAAFATAPAGAPPSPADR